LWPYLARDRFEQADLLLHALAMAFAMGGEMGFTLSAVVLWPEFKCL
jgi:hypothetical protein